MQQKTTPSPAPPPCFAHEILHYERFALVDGLAEELGIERTMLEHPEATVPITVLYDAIELAARRTGDARFGFRFGLYWTKVARDGIAPMHFMLRSSPSLRAACRQLLRHQAYWNRAEQLELVEDDSTWSIRFRPWGPAREAHAHQAEKIATLIAQVPAGLGSDYTPIAVAFTHESSARDDEIAAVLGVNPTYGAPRNEITFPTDVLDRALPHANPAMFGFMDRYLERVLEKRPGDDESFASQVRTVVQSLLERGVLARGTIARTLGCGERRLSRRLAAEGTSLRDLVDDARRQRAEELLEKGFSISEVAFRLAYSEAPAFLHAFRRWHGTSPGAWRTSRTA